MSKEVGAGGRFDIFLDSAFRDFCSTNRPLKEMDKANAYTFAAIPNL